MLKKYITLLLYVVIAGVIFSCASDFKKRPSGGLDDRLAPQVLFTNPVIGSLNQDRDLHAEIEFNEFIKFSSTKKALSISPLTADSNSTVVWGEKSVDISFKDLEDNTTVLVIVNTSLQDIQGNGLADNFVLTFSTGAAIDSTEFSGSADFAIKDNALVSMDQKYTKVLLYKYQEVLDKGLSKSRALYRAGVNMEHDFTLPHLKRDLYLPLVFQDGNSNNKLDVDAGELYSFGKEPVDLRSADRYFDTFTCSAADTIPPIIKDISEENIDLLKVEFSETIAADTAIIDSIIMNKRNIFKYECRREGEENTLYAVVDSLQEGAEMALYTSDFRDMYENTVIPLMKNRVVYSDDDIVRDSLQLIGRIPTSMAADDTLIVTHNKAVAPLNFTLFREGKDSLRYPLDDLVSKRPFAYKIPLIDIILKAGKYKFLISTENDTLYYNNLSIQKKRGFGSISGSVLPGAAAAEAVLLFTKIDGKDKRAESRTLTLSGKKAFKTILRPGTYLVTAYLDHDQNGRYSSGDMMSGGDLFSEKAIIHADTVLVRKNWESNGIDFNFDQ